MQLDVTDAKATSCLPTCLPLYAMNNELHIDGKLHFDTLPEISVDNLPRVVQCDGMSIPR